VSIFLSQIYFTAEKKSLPPMIYFAPLS